MVDTANSSPFPRRVAFLVGGLLLFRLLYAAIFPVNPAGDEAYYWDWGRHLDYGYYSKPPMIAWVYAFVDWIGGGSLFAIRAFAALLGTLSLLLLFKLTSSLFDEETGWIAVLIAAVAPANSVLSFFLTIDAPLVICWSTALWMLWRSISGEGKTGSLVLLFLALGIGHLTKQMMMVFPILTVLFLALHRDTRSHLRRPALWLFLFGSYLSLLPPLIWNAQNGWITFQHTSHHFETVSDGGNVIVERAGDFVSFLGTQLGVLGPGTAIVLFPICLVSLWSIREASKPARFLLIFGALPLAGMLLLALRQGLQPNWPAVFYVSCFSLTAAWYTGKIRPSFPPQKLRGHLKLSVAISAALVAFFYLGPLVFQAIGKEGHEADPNRRVLGHDELASQFEIIRAGQTDAQDLFLVAFGHRDVASHLAFGLPDQPKLYRWEASGKIVSQYEMWNNPLEDGLKGKDALLLVPVLENVPRRFRKAFAKIEKLDEFEVSFGYDRKRKFTVFRATDLQTWPEGGDPRKN
ncbi:MAG: glycosyltransferase family 39 protein [Verrucomicrobiales bacterium]|nr:glycosyltransferase family 39 protein [Verrucomicrobiales bacterium]